MTDACADCGENLQGLYCHRCGQKRLVDGDRHLRHLLGQAFAAATDLDGRFWGTLRTLVARPGQLSRDYLDGRRRRWMSPTALFLLANVLYFLSPAGLTDFNLPLADQLAQPHSGLTRSWVIQRVAGREAAARAAWERLPDARRPARPPDYTLRDYALQYDAQAVNVGKALIVVHVPVLALGLLVAFRRRRLYFAEHVVVATHLFTFMLLFIQCVMLPGAWLYRVAGFAGPMPGWAALAALSLIGLHFTLALRRVYGCGWAAALLLPPALLGLVLAGNLWIYRFLQFAVTFALT